LPGTYTVTVDGSLTSMAGLVLGGESGTQTLTATSRNITVNGDWTIGANGVVSVTSSTLGGFPATITNAGTITLIASNVSSTASLENQGVINGHGLSTIFGPLTTTSTSIIRVQGQSLGASANLTVSNGFTNNGLIEFTSANGTFNATLTVTAGTLVNAESGTIRTLPGTGGNRTLAAQISNEGLIDVEQPLTLNKAEADHLNFGGTLDLTTANLTVIQTGETPTFTNNGSILLGVNRTFTVTGGEVNTLGGTISGDASSTLSVSNATLSFTPLVVTVPLTLTNTIVLGGAVSIPSGATLTLLHGAVSDDITVEAGGVLLTHGSVFLTGALTQNGTLRVRGQSNGGNAALTVADGFTNAGLIELTSVAGGLNANLTVTNGILTNAEGATIHALPGTGGSRSLTAQIDNQGTIDVDVLLTINRAGSTHLNSGAIDLTTANLTLAEFDTFTNTGTVTLGANRTWTVSLGTLDLSAGSVSGQVSSTLSVTSGTLGFTTSTVTIPMTLSATAITGNAITIPNGETLTLLNGGVTAPITIQAGGTLVTLGTVSLSGTMSIASGGILRVQGQTFGGNATLTIANGFTNAGTIDLTSADAEFSSTLNVTNLILLNQGESARIFASAGSGGSRTLAAALDNRATVDVNATLALNKQHAHHVNYGTIDLTDADLTLTQTGDGPSFSNTGTVVLGANRSWTTTGGLLDIAEGGITGQTSSRLIVTGATLALTPENLSNIPVTLTSTSISGGSLTIGTSAQLTLLDGEVNDPVTIASAGTLTIIGSVALNQTLSVQSGGVLRVRGQANGGNATATVANSFTNAGLIDLISVDVFDATLAVTAGTLTNASGGVIQIWSGGARTIAAQLDNQGSIAIASPLTIDKPSAQHLNSGTINVQYGNLTVTQSGTSPSFRNTGSILLGENRDWTTTGGLLDVDEGTVTGFANSRLVVTGATLAMTPATVQIPMTLTSTSLLSAPLLINDGRTVTLIAGGLSDAVTVGNGGTLVILGSVALGGTFSVADGGTLVIRGQTFGDHATLAVANSFTHAGLMRLTSTGVFNSTIAVTTGTLTIADAAAIHVEGEGGLRRIEAEIANSGDITVSQPLTIAKASAAHTNLATGNISVNANTTVTQSGTTPSFTNTGQIFLSSGQALTVSGGTFTNAFGDPSGVIQGSGTLDVATATFSNSGEVRPSGTLSVTGAFSQPGPNGLVASELRSSDYDQLAVSGAATLGGNLVLTNGGRTLNVGDTFTIMSFASMTGAFGSVSGAGVIWTVDYTATTAVARVVSIP
jgi:hypothetical protein